MLTSPEIRVLISVIIIHRNMYVNKNSKIWQVSAVTCANYANYVNYVIYNIRQVNENNVRSVIGELVTFLSTSAPAELKAQLTSTIILCADKYAPSKRWYVWYRTV